MYNKKRIVFQDYGDSESNHSAERWNGLQAAGLVYIHFINYCQTKCLDQRIAGLSFCGKSIYKLSEN